MKKVKIGVVITARDVFPPREYAKKNAELIKAKLDEIFAQMPRLCYNPRSLLNFYKHTGTVWMPGRLRGRHIHRRRL